MSASSNFVLGVEVHIDDTDKSHWTILLVTPIMRRAHKLTEASEIIFVDSTGSCDADQSVLTFVSTATKGGAVPLAVLIHSRQDQIGFENGFNLLKSKYPKCFGGNDVRKYLTFHACQMNLYRQR